MTFYGLIKGIITVALKLTFRIEVTGLENIPKEGRIIICANHISNWDPIFVAVAVHRQVFFMAKKQLFNIKILKPILEKLGVFPVDRDGADLSAVRNALKVLKGENILGMFPEGTRTRHESADNAKPGIAMIAIKGKSPIIPIYISSSYKVFSKIKIVIGESLLLDENYNKRFTIEDYKQMSELVMNSIFDLKNNLVTEQRLED